MFANFVQKWNAFKSDFEEYKKLRRIAPIAKRNLLELRGKITVFISMDEKVSRKRCIQSKLLEVPRRDACDTVLDPAGAHYVQCEHYCPNFRAVKDKENAQPCTDTACPCYAANKAYAEAAAHYTDALKKRRAFWNKNNTNVKQM